MRNFVVHWMIVKVVNTSCSFSSSNQIKFMAKLFFSIFQVCQWISNIIINSKAWDLIVNWVFDAWIMISRFNFSIWKQWFSFNLRKYFPFTYFFFCIIKILLWINNILIDTEIWNFIVNWIGDFLFWSSCFNFSCRKQWLSWFLVSFNPNSRITVNLDKDFPFTEFLFSLFQMILCINNILINSEVRNFVVHWMVIKIINTSCSFSSSNQIKFVTK